MRVVIAGNPFYLIILFLILFFFKRGDRMKLKTLPNIYNTVQLNRAKRRFTM